MTIWLFQSHCLSRLYNLYSEQHSLSLDPRLGMRKILPSWEKKKEETQRRDLTQQMDRQHNKITVYRFKGQNIWFKEIKYNICEGCGARRTSEQARASPSGARPPLYSGDLEEDRPFKITRNKTKKIKSDWRGVTFNRCSNVGDSKTAESNDPSEPRVCRCHHGMIQLTYVFFIYVICIL